MKLGRTEMRLIRNLLRNAAKVKGSLTIENARMTCHLRTRKYKVK